MRNKTYIVGKLFNQHVTNYLSNTRINNTIGVFLDEGITKELFKKEWTLPVYTERNRILDCRYFRKLCVSLSTKSIMKNHWTFHNTKMNLIDSKGSSITAEQYVNTTQQMVNILSYWITSFWACPVNQSFLNILQ